MRIGLTLFAMTVTLCGLMAARPQTPTLDQEEGADGLTQTGSQTVRPADGPRKSKVVVAWASTFQGTPTSIGDLWTPDVIVVLGRAEAIDGEWMPDPHEPFQQTIYRFKVARYIQDDGVQPDVLRVAFAQGHLAWRERNAPVGGTAFRFAEMPIMTVGEEYLLFLRRSREVLRPLGPKALVDSSGKELPGLDNCVLAHNKFGMFQIVDGKVQTPIDTEIPPFAPNAFKNGPQLLGTKPADVVPMIRKVFAERAVRHRESAIPPLH